MATSYLDYTLQGTYIHNWLVAGPVITPLSSADPEAPSKISTRFYDQNIPYSQEPADQSAFEFGETQSTWKYTRCALDHFVTLAGDCPVQSHLRAWAYTQVRVQDPQTAAFLLTTCGPADVWLNGAHIFRQEDFASAGTQTIRFTAVLQAEYNELLVRFENVAAGQVPLLLALQMADLPAEQAEEAVDIRIPTLARRPSRQLRLERIFEYAYLEQVVDYRGEHFNLRWANDLDDNAHFHYEIQDAKGNIYVSGNADADPEKPTDVGQEFRLYERQLWVVVKATGMEYFEQNLRYQRRMPIYILDNAYSQVPYGQFNERNREALVDASKFDHNLFAEIAKMELEQWDKVKPEFVLEAVAAVDQRELDSPLLLVGLLGLLYRFGDQAFVQEHLQAAIEACVLNFPYESDGSPDSGVSESDRILLHTAEILAGQRYPDQAFTNGGQTGEWHRAQGEQRARDWLLAHGQRGFTEWNSPLTYAHSVVALAHLTSLAQDQLVAELAAISLDKIFFLLAVNSFWGSFSSAHGRTGAGMLKSAQLDATSGIQRMMWGLGVFNPHIAAPVSLACSTYEFPLHIADIAIDPAEEIWSKERHAGTPAGTPDANLVTYKTPQYMLSSVQDYRPGERGANEHVWQATFGPEAVVFANHPACASEDEAQRPGWWRGNAVLPRVAQWKDVLIAVHNLPDDDWLGFTHAYFPVYAFQEHVFKDGWAFARMGDGYLALTASGGFEQVERGPDGYRELRSPGKRNIWLVHMGRAALDESFEKFQEKILSMKVMWQPEAQSVSCINLHGEELVFGWEGPLLVNGKAQPLSGFKHLDNPYCSADLPAQLMDIEFSGDVMRLNFEE